MKIRKSFYMFLAMLLVFSNAGFAFQVHYCGGEIASVKPVFNLEIPAAGSEKCCAVWDDSKGSCCKDKLLKSEKPQDTVIKAISLQIDVPILAEVSMPVFTSAIFHIKQLQTVKYYCDPHGPPLFRLYNQYLFYA